MAEHVASWPTLNVSLAFARVSRRSTTLRAPPAARWWVLFSSCYFSCKFVLRVILLCLVAWRSKFNVLVAFRTPLPWLWNLGHHTKFSLFRTYFMLKPHLNIALTCCVIKRRYKMIEFLPLTSSLTFLPPIVTWYQEHVMNWVPSRHHLTVNSFDSFHSTFLRNIMPGTCMIWGTSAHPSWIQHPQEFLVKVRDCSSPVPEILGLSVHACCQSPAT